MSDLHELCYFKVRPINEESYLKPLKEYLKAGIPATYTLEEAENYEKGIETDELPSTTTPLHLICESIPKNDITEEEETTILKMIDELFLNGAGWCLTNAKDETPGCVLARRGLNGSKYWESIVDGGVRAEMLLRKLNDPNVEFLDDDEMEVYENNLPEEYKQEPEQEEIPDLVDDSKTSEEKVEKDEKVESKETENSEKTFEQKVNEIKEELINDPSNTTSTYLKTKLEYKDGALVTEERGDGVMMQWEDKLMQAASDSLFKSIDDPKDVNIVNIGFGMGIIDTVINSKNPTKHYICEAHPDVLKKMEEDGWFEKPNVVVLKGKWQDTLPDLLNQGVFFDGIYYDTYSEHYEDMLELFDLIVGLLKPTGIFSFFNGLGADRLVVYEVYKKIVDIDLSNYGLEISFAEIKAPETTLEENDGEENSVWKDIKRAYWRCPVYYHPEARFA